MHDELLIAKLHELLQLQKNYSLSMTSLKLLRSYLVNRKRRIKMNDIFSSCTEILYGVPQGSILGPSFFLNNYLCDLFMFITDFDVGSYADDNTPYTTEKDL